MNSTGIIFDIQRFSLHDGPGIRTTVFMKGCPLECLWCSNPESQGFLPEIAYFKNKCCHCRHCLAICPQQALRFDRSGNLQVNGERCRRCGKCAINCPSGSISLIGNTWTVSEVIEAVKRDIPFYRRSGGGVTLSGGEPLHQAPFVGELLQTCKKLYLHTAIQTTGYGKWDSLTAIRPFVDLFIFDLKTVDPIQHQLLTGQDNTIIKENLDRLLHSGDVELVVQIPIIPGYNDSIPSLQQFGVFLSERKSLLKGVSVIPYHRLGTAKYVSLGKEYGLKGVEPTTPGAIEAIRDFFRSRGLSILTFG